MDFIDWKIVIACVGAGIGAELIRRYRSFKTKRRSIPSSERNARFWTDRRLYLAELMFCVAVVALPFSAIVVFATIDRPEPLGRAYLGLLAYSLLVFLLMKSLNTTEPQ